MIPIVTPAEMAAVDAAAPEPVGVLIERAGAAVARAAVDLLGGTYGRRVVVLAGKGNNGNDGRAAARRLEARGVRCTLVDPAAMPSPLPACDLVIDAAYGTGFRGTFTAPELTHPEPPVLAVDIPSGVNGLTGETAGRVLRATRTVTFAALKPGLLLGRGVELAGDVTVADIGLDVIDLPHPSCMLVERRDVAAWIPRRGRGAHKWRAACWIVAGSPGMTGAAHLSSSAAMRAGAGYVRLSSPGIDDDPRAPTEVVRVRLPGDAWADEVIDGLDRFAALAVGPGLGPSEAARVQVRRLVSGVGLPTVVDGDGLTALGTDAAAVIGARPAPADGRPPAIVLTPHDGEAARLGGAPPGADRFAAARSLASAAGAVVLLKGPTTLVAAPDGSILATTSGGPQLASAGTGDVLTGITVALLAQGMPAHLAAAAAAFLHGRAGALAWPQGLVASDLVRRLPAALADLEE